MPLVKTLFFVPDIECDACAASIRKALARTPNIGKVAIDVEAKIVIVMHEGPVAAVIAAFDDAGFPATVQPT